MAVQPIMTTAALRTAGVSARDLLAAEQACDIFRPVPGIAVTADVYADPKLDDALICARSGGVIALLSAAMRHGLVDALPAEVEVIVAWSAKMRPPANLPVRLYRTRNADALMIGVDVEDFHGLQLRMTSPARTVVDLYRMDPSAVRQHALTALNRFDGSIEELAEIAGRFGAWDAIRPEVEAILEARSGGMRP